MDNIRKCNIDTASDSAEFWIRTVLADGVLEKAEKLGSPLSSAEQEKYGEILRDKAADILEELACSNEIKTIITHDLKEIIRTREVSRRTR